MRHHRLPGCAKLAMKLALPSGHSTARKPMHLVPSDVTLHPAGYLHSSDRAAGALPAKRAREACNDSK